jgi:hypothetical protein
MGGLMFGEASAFATAEMIMPERGPSPVSSDDTYEIALMWGAGGALLLHYALKSRRHGYQMAARCEDERHAEPSYCVVDRSGDVWRTTIVARNDEPIRRTYAVVASIAEPSSAPRELVQIVTLAPEQRREVASFAQREPITSCTVELRPVAPLP